MKYRKTHCVPFASDKLEMFLDGIPNLFQGLFIVKTCNHSLEESVSVINNSKQVERYNFPFFRSLNLFIGSARLSTTDLWKNSSKYLINVKLARYGTAEVPKRKQESELLGTLGPRKHIRS